MNTKSLNLVRASTQYAYINSALGLTPSSERTFDFWVKITTAPTSGQNFTLARILFTGTGSNYTDISYLNVSGTFKLGINTSPAQFTVNQTLTVDKWYHIAITHDGDGGASAINVYLGEEGVDDTLVLTGDSWLTGSYGALTTRLVIGGAHDFTDNPNARFDDFRVWNAVRTLTEINDNKDTELVGNETNLIAYYKFADNLLDETSNNYDLTGVGTPTYNVDIPSWSSASAPTVTTQAVTDIESTTATGNGNVTDDGGDTITERGVCWSTSPTPTTGDNTATSAGTTGAFTASMTGLSAGTTYYVRAYAINGEGTSYGSEVSFTTDTTPTVTTQAVTDIESTTATGNGNVTSDNGDTVTERGVVISTSPTPTTSDTKISVAGTTGAFTANITGLTAATTYYVRAYAINSAGTAYGNEVSFETDSTATVTTQAVTEISVTTATGNGNVTDDGGDTITERGVCWSTSTTPTTGDNTATAAGTTGAFTAAITGLTEETTYYVRAYAVNSLGTSYGSQVSFTTAASPETFNALRYWNGSAWVRLR